MDEGSLGNNNPRADRNKNLSDSGQPLESASSSAHNSLGRKQKTKSTGFAKFKGGGLEVDGMVFGSLGRQSLVNKSGGESGDSGTSGGSGMERRKRKADEDIEGDSMNAEKAGPQLESVTKHRVKGPSGKK